MYLHSAQNLQIVEGLWLRASLQGPVPKDRPEISNIGITAMTRSPDNAFANERIINTDKNFFPFGERPKTGDVFYLASRQSFSHKGWNCSIRAVLAKVGDKRNNLTIIWEAWTGTENRLAKIKNINGGDS